MTQQIRNVLINIALINKVFINTVLSLCFLLTGAGCSILTGEIPLQGDLSDHPEMADPTDPTDPTLLEDSAITKFVLPALNEAQRLQAQEAKRDYEKALEYLKKGENKHSLTLLKSITTRYPDLSGPWLNQGIIHINFNNLIEAEKAFKQALTIYPDNPYTLNMLGIVLREQGQFKKAKQHYEKALKIDKHYAKAHLNLGILADLYLRNFPLALDHFEQYQALQPTSDRRISGWIKDLKRRIRAGKV